MRRVSFRSERVEKKSKTHLSGGGDIKTLKSTRDSSQSLDDLDPDLDGSISGERLEDNGEDEVGEDPRVGVASGELGEEEVDVGGEGGGLHDVS